MDKRVLRGLAIVAISAAGLVQINNINLASAESSKFSATLLDSTTVTIPQEPIDLAIRPSSSGTFGSTNFNVIVATNQPGYTLTMTTSSTALTSSTVNPSTNERFTIPTLDYVSGGYTQSNFTVNRWGISIDGGNYNAIAASQQLKDTNVRTNGDTTTIGVGANLNLLTASGTYETTVNFAVVTKVDIRSINELTNLQDFAGLTSANLSKVKNSMVANTQYQLKDSRDNKDYNIAKIGDVIWMTTNLNIAGGTTLTSEKSNVINDYTLPDSSLSGFTSIRDDVAYVYNDNSIGGSYSYTAATAGTNPSSDNATEDICPAGWRLPTLTEYDSLRTTYNSPEKIVSAPWNGTYGGGLVRSGSRTNPGQTYYWTSTAAGGAQAYSMYFYEDSVTIGTYSGASKGWGMLVRCVAK